jgi:enoyl-[acyl-carrier protein] reductase II
VKSGLRVCELFSIQYPIIQAGMVWCSGWRLASAVSNKGGLGLIGAGSMYPEVLRTHIQKCKRATSNPFGVNIPLLYPDIELLMNILVEEGVKIVFTSAGSPAKWAPFMKDHGITHVHVVPNVKLAQKCESLGLDAVVCEGFEAGGHNGKDELTSMVLIPQVADAVSIPVIAAGGIADGRGIAAAIALGADGVQIGSRFAVTVESSAHQAFKHAIIEADDTATMLVMKQLVPVRLIRNAFYDRVAKAERDCADTDVLKEILGRGRAKKGIFEGDLDEGELEIGQNAGMIRDLPNVSDLFDRLVHEYNLTAARLGQSQF